MNTNNRNNKNNKNEELLDIAYRIATGHHLTECFGFSEFINISIEDFVCEDFEYFNNEGLEEHISNIANSIYSSLIKERNTK